MDVPLDCGVGVGRVRKGQCVTSGRSQKKGLSDKWAESDFV